MDTHEVAKVQRLEQQLHRVTPEPLNEPCSAGKFKVTEEEKGLVTSEDEKHLRDFGGRKKANMNSEGLKVKILLRQFDSRLLIFV